MDDNSEIVNGILLELRRGTLILCVLSQLKEPQYGYSLVQKLEEKGISIEVGTVYPLLRRLETQKLIESSWKVIDARPRRYYVLSTMGKEVYSKLCKEWRSLTVGLEGLIDN